MAEKIFKILVVDDEPDILEIIQYNLRNEGYEVVTAKNGNEAIEMAKIEKSNPYFSVSDSDFSSIKATIDRLYGAEVLTDKQGIFDIFQPVCNSAVSKAIVAQYLAQILIKEKKIGVNVEEMILSEEPSLPSIISPVDNVFVVAPFIFCDAYA